MKLSHSDIQGRKTKRADISEKSMKREESSNEALKTSLEKLGAGCDQSPSVVRRVTSTLFDVLCEFSVASGSDVSGECIAIGSERRDTTDRASTSLQPDPPAFSPHAPTLTTNSQSHIHTTKLDQKPHNSLQNHECAAMFSQMCCD